jgi:dynein heavy chain
VSIKVLGNALSKQPDIPWPALQYLIGDVIYGGRLTDIWDSRCLKTLLYKFCSPKVLKGDFSFSGEEVREKFIFLNYSIT